MTFCLQLLMYGEPRVCPQFRIEEHTRVYSGSGLAAPPASTRVRDFFVAFCE